MGRLLVDRLMKKNGLVPQKIGNMERLAIVGKTGMCALTYKTVSFGEFRRIFWNTAF